MIFKPDTIRKASLLILGPVFLAGCEEATVDQPPIDEARAALASNDPVGAELQLRQLLAEGTPREELAALLGEAEIQQGSLAEAREWLGPGAFSQGTAAHGFHMLGRLEMREGNLPAAGRAFDRALAHGNSDAGLWVDIGRLRYLGGEQIQALEASVRATEISPDDPEALLFRGQLIRDSRGMREALPWLEEAVQINPDDPRLLAEYAATLGELGRASEMLSVVRRLSAIDPGNREAQYLQAVLAARAGKFDLSLALLQRSGKLESEVPAALMLFGIIDLERGNFASAAQTFERLRSLQPDNRRIDPLLARALSLGRNEAELLYFHSGSASRASSSNYSKTLVARAMEASGSRIGAGELLDEASFAPFDTIGVVQPDNTLVVARTRMNQSAAATPDFVRAAISSRLPGEATAAARTFTNIAPGSGDAKLLLGDALLSSGRISSAYDAYSQASRVRRPWTLAFKMALAMGALGEKGSVTPLLQEFQLGEPRNVEAMTVLAIQHARAGNWSAAADFADYAILIGAARDPSVLAIRAQAALELGDVGLAVSYAEAAHDLQPMFPLAAQVLADAYRAADAPRDLVELAEQKAAMLST